MSNAPSMTPLRLLTEATRADVQVADERVAAAALCSQAPRLRRLVHRLLGWQSRSGVLDDLVQDVLLAAWRHRATFRGESSLATWLHRIALRTVQNHVRQQNVRRRFFGWLRGEPAAPPCDHGAADRTHGAMQKLAHQDREILVLRYLEHHPIEDLVRLLGCSRAAVDARLSRARARLRAALGEEGG